jgi:2-dehydropantoate 2-reductase
MRYIVYGAGAIGGTIGACLHEAGRDVTLIARGAHGQAIDRNGLRFGSPERGWRVLRIPVVSQPAVLRFRSGDIVVLSMKSQDTVPALEALAAAAPQDIRVACAQNGVENERAALRRFPNVHGMCLRMPGVHLEPGVVQVHQLGNNGICDVGRYPSGATDVDHAIAADLRAANFLCDVREDIMALKYAKLHLNVTNALEAAIGPGAPESALSRRARAEALEVFAAAGQAVAIGSDPRVTSRVLAAVDGMEHVGNSSFQSLARGTPRLEADYLNGEVVLLGRQFGIPTPANALLQNLALRLVAARVPAGSLTIEDVEAGHPLVVADRAHSA